jgi:DNA replication and repair protein RecF
MITDIRLQHFRSYDDDAFEFGPTVNIIVGPNASGKTNLLEAILMTCWGASYRARDVETITFEEPWARIDLRTDHSLRTLKIVRDAATKRVYEIDAKPYRRLPLNQTIPVVVFEPNHLTLLSGSPEQRRNYLDDLLEQSEPGFAQIRRQYKRTLQQRNALLKTGTKAALSQLFPWNVRLSELAGKVARSRARLLDDVNLRLTDLYQQLSHTAVKLDAVYGAEFQFSQYETKMLHKLEAAVSEDAARGFTSHGPHREDFIVYYDDRPAAEIVSRGETRTALLALKILELNLLERARDQAPLLLLDDVFSELDGSRRKLLTSYIERYQTFISTTDADIVVQNFTETCNIIPLGNG